MNCNIENMLAKFLIFDNDATDQQLEKKRE